MSDFLDSLHRDVTDEAIRAERDLLRRALSGLLIAYPRLASEHSTSEQQKAMRIAVCALEETKP